MKSGMYKWFINEKRYV